MKKQTQLGMNPGTASNRLVKDILFKFVSEAGHTCYRCGKEMSRENFSIEHKKPWLDSEDPKAMFFDLDNIAFSHLKCNSRERRITVVAICGTRSRYVQGCRCAACKSAHADYAKKKYDPDRRSSRYIRNGK